MQFIDLKAQYDLLRDGIEQRMQAVLEHGGYIMGPEVAILEQDLAAYCGVDHTVSCANGTDALVLALRAFEIGPGDAVFTTPFSFFATVEAIMLVGATPVFADIDPRTFNIDPGALELAIDSTIASRILRPRAAISVDLFGLPADYETIEPLCSRHGLDLIEDAAQGFGGAIGDRRCGSFGRVATTSFFPAKPLGCYGDGGALFTDDAQLADRLWSLRVHGKGSDKYDNVRIGTNSRLDTLQAAILIEKLTAFPREMELRQLVASRYSAHLPEALTGPHVPAGYLSSWAQYSVLARSACERERLMAALNAKDIPTMVYYGKPLHLQPALRDLGLGPGDFPIAENVSSRIFSLPIGPYLGSDHQDEVIAALRKATA